MVRKMFRCVSNEKAFTLIEVIAALVLVGILAALAGMGLVKIAEGYVFAKQNTETVQKAQIAIARIVKELGAATTISSISTSPPLSITYTRPGAVGNIIAFSGAANDPVTINGVALINNVTAFTLIYFDAAGVTTTTAAKIRRIDIALSVTGANNTPISFNTITVFIQEFI